MYVRISNEGIEWREAVELGVDQYTFEDFKKCPIGTRVTFEGKEVLVKTGEDEFENEYYYRSTEDLKKFKDNVGVFGKIIKIEEPNYTTVYKKEIDILDSTEKRYLAGVIRPFRDKVTTIARKNLGSRDFIQIALETDEVISFPFFNKDSMYKGMKAEKRYSLKELKL